jgi:hypothetical protein
VNAATRHARDEFLLQAQAEIERKCARADALLAAAIPMEHEARLRDRLEGLRQRRDVLATKLVALRHHRRSGWDAAVRDLRRASGELEDAWRLVMSDLARRFDLPADRAVGPPAGPPAGPTASPPPDRPNRTTRRRTTPCNASRPTA